MSDGSSTLAWPHVLCLQVTEYLNGQESAKSARVSSCCVCSPSAPLGAGGKMCYTYYWLTAALHMDSCLVSASFGSTSVKFASAQVPGLYLLKHGKSVPCLDSLHRHGSTVSPRFKHWAQITSCSVFNKRQLRASVLETHTQAYEYFAPNDCTNYHWR